LTPEAVLKVLTVNTKGKIIPSELTPQETCSAANAEGKGAWLLIPSELTPEAVLKVLTVNAEGKVLGC
jgi:hypothetical protein